MTATVEQAEDEMRALFKAFWDANTASIVGYVPEVRWQGIEKKATPDGSRFWCRFSTQEVVENLNSLSDCVQADGQRRYEHGGLIYVQIFAPKAEANSFRKGKQLAKVARNSFRGKSTSPGNVWFRKARINEIPSPDVAVTYQFNVVIEYSFDEIG